MEFSNNLKTVYKIDISKSTNSDIEKIILEYFNLKIKPSLEKIKIQVIKNEKKKCEECQKNNFAVLSCANSLCYNCLVSSILINKDRKKRNIIECKYCTKKYCEITKIKLSCGCIIDDMVISGRYLSLFPTCIRYWNRKPDEHYCVYCKEDIKHEENKYIISSYFFDDQFASLSNELYVILNSISSFDEICFLCKTTERPTIPIFACDCKNQNKRMCYFCLSDLKFSLKKIPPTCLSLHQIKYSQEFKNLFTFLRSRILFKFNEEIYKNIKSAMEDLN